MLLPRAQRCSQTHCTKRSHTRGLPGSARAAAAARPPARRAHAAHGQKLDWPAARRVTPRGRARPGSCRTRTPEELRGQVRHKTLLGNKKKNTQVRVAAAAPGGSARARAARGARARRAPRLDDRRRGRRGHRELPPVLRGGRQAHLALARHPARGRRRLQHGHRDPEALAWPRWRSTRRASPTPSCRTRRRASSASTTGDLWNYGVCLCTNQPHRHAVEQASLRWRGGRRNAP